MGAINIWGKYKDKEIEKIDSASSQSAASYLVREYKMAFGGDWVIWAGKKVEWAQFSNDRR
jgi:hypothetical protein